MRAGRERNRWKIDSGNQLIVLQICIALRRVTGQSMKICERNFAFAFRSADANDRVEGGEGNAHVARMRRDALFALAENGVDAIVTIDRAATAPGIPFVACGKGWVVEIITARALQKIAADRRHVAQLRTRTRKQRFT